MNKTKVNFATRTEPWESDPTIEVHVFDMAEGRGKVGLRPCSYGLEIYVPGQKDAVALVDLFYLSKEGQTVEGRGGHPQMIIYDSVRDEVLARALFRPDGTRVDFETGVKALGGGPAPSQCEFGFEPE